MKNVKRSKNKIESWDTVLDEKYGMRGTLARTEFEMKSQAFILGELLKEERAKAHMTQAEMAEKTGTKKSYISRIENDASDIRLTTLMRIVRQGFGKRLKMSVEV